MTDITRRTFSSVACLLLALPLFNCGGGSSGTGGSTGSGGSTSSGSVGSSGGTAPDGGTMADAGDPPPPVDAPAWLANRALNEWFEIPGTAGAGSSAVIAFSGFALKDSTSEIIIAAAGGHGDSSDNSVVSLVLQADAPAWVQRAAPSATPEVNVAYYADGLPASRHTYQSTHVIESLDRVFLFGCRFSYGAAYEFPVVDGFNLSTNKWDPAGTWTSIPSGYNYGAVRVRATDDVYTSALGKWEAKTQSWSQPIATKTSVRWPIASDSLRNELFTLQWGDGQGYDGPKVFSTRVSLASGTQVDITFNPSAAFTQFQSDAPTYSAMDYDPDNDRFLFYCGQGAGVGRIYVVKPNDSTVWDMSLLALGPGSVVPSDPTGSGVNNRFRYVPNLKGFVLLAHPTSNLYFIRTA